MGESLEREREVKNAFSRTDGHIYKWKISLSELVTLSELSPLCGIALSMLVSLRELSKEVIWQIPTLKK